MTLKVLMVLKLSQLQHYLDSVRTSLMASLPVHQGKEVHILILVKTSKAKIHAQPNNLQQSLGETSRVKRKINICSLISYVAIPKPSFNFKDFDEIKQRGVRPDMLIDVIGAFHELGYTETVPGSRKI